MQLKWGMEVIKCMGVQVSITRHKCYWPFKELLNTFQLYDINSLCSYAVFVKIKEIVLYLWYIESEIIDLAK